MTPLHTYAAGFGATIRPHPATDPAPADGGAVVVVVPTLTWRDVDDLPLPGPRTDTTSVVLVAPALQRDGFVPNVIATASIITPAVPLAGLLDAVMASMEDAADWNVRARSVTVGDTGRGRGDDDNDDHLVLDLLGTYRAGRTGLALSSLVRARTVGGVTVLHQTHATTLADQVPHHTEALAAAGIRYSRAGSATPIGIANPVPG